MRKMRLGSTRKRTGKDGTFSLNHVDRNFDITKADNIDISKVHENDYWKNPNMGINGAKMTQKEFMIKCYEKLFENYIKKTNEKAIKSRHKERMINAEMMLKKPRTAPEGMLLYFGDKNGYAPRDIHIKMRDEFLAWHAEKYPNLVIPAAETHCDEKGAVHSSLWFVYCASDKDGDLYYNQTNCLKELGFKNNNARYDNAKKDYTKETREKLVEIAQKYGYEIELNPKAKGGQDLDDYKRDKAREEYEAIKQFIVKDKQIEKALNAFKRDKKGNYIITPQDMEKLAYTALQKTQIKTYEDALLSTSLSVVEKKKYESIIDSLKKEINDLTRMKDDRFDFIEKWLEERGLLQQLMKDYKDRRILEKTRLEMSRNNTIELLADYKRYFDDLSDFSYSNDNSIGHER